MRRPESFCIDKGSNAAPPIQAKDKDGNVSDGTATFTIDHFTVFAILAGPATTGQLIPGATPATSAPSIVSTPITAASAASFPHASGGGLNAGTWAGIVVGIILEILIAIYIFMRWRQSLHY